MASTSLSQQQALQQRLLQKLSPQQVRFFRLLEMSRPALEEEVQRELDDNPALTVRPDSLPADTPAEPQQLADMSSARRYGASSAARSAALENVAGIDEGETLRAAIERQLALLPMTPARRERAMFIAGSLDSNGYLAATLPELQQELWQATGHRPSPEDIRQAVNDVRSLEPAGIGAVDLRDCLLLQLPASSCPPATPRAAAREIVADWFDLLTLKHYDKLSRALGLSHDRLREAIEVIRSLNPKPGAAFVSEADYGPGAAAIAPDFAIEPDENAPGRLRLTMPNSLPELEIEESFAPGATALTAGATGRAREAAARFIAGRRDSARAFIELLNSRRATMLRIMRAIVTLQHPFFLSGDEAELRPMVLKDVAAVTGDDPSTISRATQGKYVATPWRIYPLRFFFSERAGLATDASQRSVADTIRTLIAAENPSAPLSDEAIRAELSRRGLDVARRTIAKHRETLGIPVARLRRHL